MAVDTKAKRFAMLSLGSLVANLIIIDSAISDEDKLSNLGLYNGIELDPPPEPGDAYGWYSPYRRRRVNNAKIVAMRYW
jgi:hypothetical protein